LLGQNIDENLVVELSSTNSAVFEMLLDVVHGRDVLTADQIITLLHSIRRDASLPSSFPKMFCLQLLSSRFFQLSVKLKSYMYIGRVCQR